MAKYRKPITLDGLNNVYKSIGSQKDITTNTYYTRNPYISQNAQMVNGLYSHWMGGKAVDIPTQDAFKGGRKFICEDTAKLDEYLSYLDKNNIDKKIKELMTWSKIFGTAIAIIISDDDVMSNPLVIENIKQGDIKNIIILDRWQVYSTELNQDMLSDNYLKPEYYQLSKTAEKIHYSRVIRLDALNTTLQDKELLGGWGLSIFEKFYKEIQNAQLSPDILVNLIAQSNLDVYKLQDLNDTLVSDDSLITKRVQYAQMGKSIFNGVLLDKEDDYINISKSFAGLDSVHNVLIDLMCGAVDIPKTRFMNIQNSGLANNGAGDLAFYYDRIESNERAKLKDVYVFLDELLTRSLFGEPLELSFEFISLYQMSEEQKSNIRNKDAQTNQIYLNAAVITTDEVKQVLAEDTYYTSITQESINKDNDISKSLDEIDGEK